MDYIVDEIRFNFSYQELKANYLKIIQYTDDEFLSNLPEILHFACFVSYLKGLNSVQTLSDVGIIHQLVHLLHIADEPIIILSDIRQQFNNLLKLS